METLIRFFLEPLTQTLMWLTASVLIFIFQRAIHHAQMPLRLLAMGVFLYGIRIGYKMLPFATASEILEATRYVIGVMGILLIFSGIALYCRQVRDEKEV